MKFTESHEWIKLSDVIATIGITNYAQQELGDIVYVELPKVGFSVKAGDPICVLESTKSAVDLYSPLSGEVVEVNQALKESPEKINVSPFQEGWIFKIKITTLDELESYMDEQRYNEFVKK